MANIMKNTQHNLVMNCGTLPQLGLLNEARFGLVFLFSVKYRTSPKCNKTEIVVLTLYSQLITNFVQRTIYLILVWHTL